MAIDHKGVGGVVSGKAGAGPAVGADLEGGIGLSSAHELEDLGGAGGVASIDYGEGVTVGGEADTSNSYQVAVGRVGVGANVSPEGPVSGFVEGSATRTSRWFTWKEAWDWVTS
jgi:hypothetical protein